MDMAPAPVSSNPRSVEEIFKDFSGRRAGLVRALTSDVDDFCSFCDPDKENLCLYGLPNGTWEVSPSADEVPPELPEPALSINFSRDGMQRRDWRDPGAGGQIQAGAAPVEAPAANPAVAWPGRPDLLSAPPSSSTSGGSRRGRSGRRRRRRI
ncbi:PHD finger protein ALFIN-LIKE 2-like [Miscanthus floridulus]|uniref:PHD finger protein ALFIN-LIKE 2-like n=1 Tax=Miscanthus floridulus TaxID=154761 RepID=UPI00345932DA